MTDTDTNALKPCPIERAREALLNLAGVSMDISLERWSELSGTILAGLEAARPQQQNTDINAVEATLAHIRELLVAYGPRYIEKAIKLADTALASTKAPSPVAGDVLAYLEAEARRFAGFYPDASDGRNTFVIFADKIAALEANPSVDAELEIIADEVAARIASLQSRISMLEEAGRELAGREAAYRKAHDMRGEGSPEVGRAWDKLRQAGHAMRAALDKGASQ